MEETSLSRIERQIDRLAEAVEKLVLIEERQRTQDARISLAEGRITVVEVAQRSTEAKVDMWINRGIGAWAIAATLFAALKTFKVF